MAGHWLSVPIPAWQTFLLATPSSSVVIAVEGGRGIKLNFRRCGKTAPDAVMSLEKRVGLDQQKKQARRAAKQQRDTETA